MSARRPASWPIWAPLVVILLVIGFLWLRGSAGGDASEPASTPTAAATGPTPTSSGGRTPDSGLPTIDESRLPKQAKETLALIRKGGPYPYRQDDGVFGNREGLLPSQRNGYYREYTVVTPGEDDRGPLRIVSGRDGDRYWTTDHYDSFRQIKEGR